MAYNKTDIRNNIQETLAKAKAVAFLIGHAPAETFRDHLECATALHSDLIDEAERDVELLFNCKE